MPPVSLEQSLGGFASATYVLLGTGGGGWGGHVWFLGSASLAGTTDLHRDTPTSSVQRKSVSPATHSERDPLVEKHWSK